MLRTASRLIVLGLSCALIACSAKPRDSVELKRGALESPVVVSVVDTDGASKSDLQVMSLTPEGASGGYVWNDEYGRATVNVEDPGAYDFYVQIGATRFYSGHDGECVLPGCTAATITVTKPTLVTVVDSSGAPVTQGDVVTFNENGAEVVYEGVDEVTGVATVYVPTAGAHRFGMFVDGDWYYSGEPGSCVYPTCQTATITVSSSGSPPSSSVMVTVVDTDGAPVSGLQVTSKTPGGATGGYVWNDESGHAAVPVEDPGSYDFYVQLGATRFYSGEDGQCVLPGCSSATITTTKPTLVTVEGPTGIPFTQGDVVTFNENGAEVVYEGLDLVTGVATVYVPTPGPHRFGIHVDGVWFYSGEPGSCVYPACLAATIVVYPPVDVTVTDTDGAPKTNLDVSSVTAAGQTFSTRTTDANGMASFRLPADDYRFSVQPDHYKFYSGAEAHCSVPGCDAASIVVSKMVRVTVKNAAGDPVPDKEFVAVPTEGEVEASYVTNEYGFCDVTLPELAWRFKAACLGTVYYSGPEGHCTLPGCEAALITLGCGGSCVGQPDGTSCNDLDGCTTADHCDDEVCVGTAVTCTASDQCHTAGTCDPATGVCSNPAKADGATCDDGNPATSSDQCTSGACAGSGSNPCEAPAPCRLPGRRDPVSNVCTYPFAENGSACDDGNSATHDDRCQSGACLGATGTCPGDYSECDDGNPCTVYDYCYNGSCRSGYPTICGASSGGCGSYCDPSTGQCATAPVPDGSSCNDGNWCSNGDSCTAGVCAGVGACTGQVAISVSELSTERRVSLPVVLTADRTSAMPSQPINVTAQYTYDGVEFRVFGAFEVKNDSPSAYVIPGYSLTVEYQSAVSQEWIPVAGASFDASGAPRPHGAPAPITANFDEAPNGSGVDYAWNGLAGTRVGSGAEADWWVYSRFVLGADALAIVTDPAQSLGMRQVIRLDAGSGLPAGGEVSGAITAPETGSSFGLTNVQLSATFDYSSPVTLTPSQAATLAIGQSITATGVISSVVSLPASDHSNYLGVLNSYAGRTFSASAYVQASSAIFGNVASSSNSVGIAAKLPVVKQTLVSAPDTVPAGYPVTFGTTLQNTGSATATSIAVEYRKDYPTYTPQPATVTAPTTLAAGETQPATVVYNTSPTQGSGLHSAIAVTWSDAAGNSYGPVQIPWYNNLSAPLPLGSIALAGQASGPVPVDVVQPLTATVRSPAGALVPGVNVQLSISGVNSQTLSATTDASGVAHFSYPGRYPGGDTIVASATITTAPAQSNSVAVFWSAPYATGCTSPDVPLDVVIAIDTSASMEGPNLVGAKAAARSFLDKMDLSRDQLGIVSFGGVSRLDGGLTSDYAQARASIDRVSAGGGFINPTNIGAGLWAALDELTSARHRPTATPIIVFVSDGGNSLGDPEPALARLVTSGIRAFTFALGADADFAMLKRIATSKNDLFYVPSANELAWLYSALRADLCRNQLPLVRAGGDQGAYGVRLPESLILHGEVHDDGPTALTTGEWTVVSGPGTVTFLDASSPETTALFSDPGTYVLRLTGSDGVHTATDDATITVDPEPSLVGAHLQVALSGAGPLSLGASETFTATLTNAADLPITDYAIQVNVTGANPRTAVLTTDANGVVTMTYVGATLGTDTLSATALGPSPLTSSAVTVQWVQPAGAYPALTQGWIGAPTHQSKVSGQVAITAGAGQTLTAGTITYWPMSAPDQVRTLATGVTGSPGDTLATLDTTVLANGPWVVKLEGTNTSGESRNSLVSVTVTGDYKPGRVVVEQTDMTVPLAGLPITVGRRYDSLEKDNVGDFGHGWSLAIGHPRLEVDPAHNVTITMPDNRRVTFYFQATSVTNSAFYAWLYGPGYVPEAGTYGSLKADGCPMMLLSGGQLVCFLENSIEYAPTTYTYTDPYGRAFVMSAAGDLTSITDVQGNKLTFTPAGITSSTGVGVTFERDEEGRIKKITGPILDALSNRQNVSYAYDSPGDLRTVTLANNSSKVQFTYQDHRLLTTKDPLNHVLRTSTYDTAGRIETDTDALGKVTSYAYDLTARKTTITNPDTGTVEQTFDTRGLLLKEVDPLGRTTEHTYDANRNELTRKNALNEVTTFTYDANGNQTTITNANGDATHITYNQYAQPVTSTDANGHTTTITYDTRGIPTKFADELGTLATFTSSEKGLPLTVTDAEGKTAYMTYDAAGNLTGRADRLGRMTRNLYDGVGRLTQVTDPRGGVTKYAYNILGPRTHVTVPTGIFAMDTRSTTYDLALNVIEEGGNGGRTTQYTYDVMNRVTKVRNPDLTTREYTRDFRGNPLTEKDEAARTTTYEYDKAGQLLKTTYPGGAFTTRAYDALGRLVTATDERGNATTYEYEAGCGCAERVTKVTDPLNRSTVTTYDAMGRRTSVTDAANHTTSYAYDDRGHLTTTTYADGTTETDDYDARGRRISHTDQMGSVTEYGYDDEGQLTSVTDALEHVTQYAYDASGNLKSVTDANNHVTSYEYDFLNRKTKRTLPLGMSETFVYNLFNDETSHKDFRGKTTTKTYDTRSRLLTKVPDPTLGEPTVTFTYNPTGTRLKMIDASGTTNYTYDTRDRLLTKATPAGTLTYTYDPAGNVATMRSSNTNGTSVDYAWDAANQLTTVTDNRAGGVTTSAYTATGRPSTLTQPSGVGATYSYDTRDRVTSLAWQQGTNPAVGSWSYGFNLRGQRTGVTEVTGRHVAYGYDAVSRLASETITNDPQGAAGNGELSYVLDPTGNRLSRTSTLSALGAQTFTYDANDQLGSDGYDANGNTTTADGHTYTYDFENRLKSKDGTAVTIVYDGDGNRVAKTAGGVTTKYLVDEVNPTGYLQVLEEVSGGAVQVAYTYGTMVVSQRRVGAGGVVSYYGYDAHGNVTFLTDAAGAVTDTYDYDAWGNVVASTGATTNTRLYTGEEVDPDLAAINLRARVYRSDQGRFLTRDTWEGRLDRPTTRNGYGYADADPARFRDPSGHLFVEDGAFARGVSTVLATPARAVAAEPEIIHTAVGIIVRHRIITFGGALAVLGIKGHCTGTRAASWFPLSGAGSDACRDEVKSCSTDYPTEPRCKEAGDYPEKWVFGDPQSAASAWSVRSGRQLQLTNEVPTEPDAQTGRKPWCPAGKGNHYDVIDVTSGEKAGAIVCCTCCIDTSAGPFFPAYQCMIANTRSNTKFPTP